MIIFLFNTLLIILGLAIFEITSSLDNAVVNGGILGKIQSAAARRFFVTWGMFFSVGVVRGILPFIIYYIPNRALGFHAAMIGFWSGDPRVVRAVQDSAPLLLIAGGMFLVLLFLHWLLAEEKTCGFWIEGQLEKIGGAWFFASAAVLMIGILCLIRSYVHPFERAANTMLAASIGIGAFFISDGFKQHAENSVEKRLGGDSVAASARRDLSNLLFLEIIDATFSIDGVVGAFAFTMVVPLILIGNGIGAYVVRRLTLGNMDRINSYEFLKNGAMYSIGFLGVAMTLEGFDIRLPAWVSPAITFACVGGFFWKSVIANKRKTLETVADLTETVL